MSEYSIQNLIDDFGEFTDEEINIFGVFLYHNYCSHRHPRKVMRYKLTEIYKGFYKIAHPRDYHLFNVVPQLYEGELDEESMAWEEYVAKFKIANFAFNYQKLGLDYFVGSLQEQYDLFDYYCNRQLEVYELIKKTLPYEIDYNVMTNYQSIVFGIIAHLKKKEYLELKEVDGIYEIFLLNKKLPIPNSLKHQLILEKFICSGFKESFGHTHARRNFYKKGLWDPKRHYTEYDYIKSLYQNG